MQAKYTDMYGTLWQGIAKRDYLEVRTESTEVNRKSEEAKNYT